MSSLNGPDPTRRVGLAELFIGFLRLGSMSIGGALPFARRAVVEQHGWLTPEEFSDLLGLCQFLPGGNVINLSVAIGMRFRGPVGALAALLGLIAGPILVVIGLGVLYARTQNLPSVQHLFGGLAAAAAGLLIALALKVARPVLSSRGALPFALAMFAAIALLRLPLLPAMCVLTPLSIWRAARLAGEAR
jgi:chromate transporter